VNLIERARPGEPVGIHADTLRLPSNGLDSGGGHLDRALAGELLDHQEELRQDVGLRDALLGHQHDRVLHELRDVETTLDEEAAPVHGETHLVVGDAREGNDHRGGGHDLELGAGGHGNSLP
jgi:hypothetical protein